MMNWLNKKTTQEKKEGLRSRLQSAVTSNNTDRSKVEVVLPHEYMEALCKYKTSLYSSKMDSLDEAMAEVKRYDVSQRLKKIVAKDKEK